ncbi:Bromodomain adjacent to zinc finger domain protein 2B [Hondaea fermentalgiana]|uniref:Bromodomain adjacent to zinc finger domain protein 2B n=1 Tax=Hondaea fermentalgiana TaxID=2315210 RepID=A0A2R5H2I2_9STRA|nr:Bromodomain adjacent to zinc finger domain protein 2B [Hondaea fermentalgiana]|eukprot:GBG35051.1 Bromodomain adjacent to zinc finger domain protein 2B [Hondaea fermentalgiana]
MMKSSMPKESSLGDIMRRRSSSANSASDMDDSPRRRRRSADQTKRSYVEDEGDNEDDNDEEEDHGFLSDSDKEKSHRRAVIAANIAQKAADRRHHTNDSNGKRALQSSLASSSSRGDRLRARASPSNYSTDSEKDPESVKAETSLEDDAADLLASGSKGRDHLTRNAEDIAADALCGALEADASPSPPAPSTSLRVKTSPSNATAASSSGDSDEPDTNESQGAVEMEGVWDGNEETWTGTWFQVELPELDAPFEYKPLPAEVDADMVDMPCELCKGSDPEGFLFCDLCNRGFHMWCCGLVEEPGPDEDWHCKSCSAVLKRFKQQLPPSRRWSGWFRMSKKAHLKGYQYKETFKVNFDYSTEFKQSNLIAKFSGDGKNRLGDFRFTGKMTYEDGKIYLRSRKSYLREPVKRKKTPSSISARKREKIADSRSVSPEPVDLRSPGASSTGPWNAGQRRASNATTPADSLATSPGAFTNGPAASTSASHQPNLTAAAAAFAASANGSSQYYVDSSDPRQVALAFGLVSRELHRLRGPKTTLVVTDLDCGFGKSNSRNEPPNQLPLLWHFVAALPGNLKWISEVPRGALEILFRMHTLEYLTDLMQKSKRDNDLETRFTAAVKACGAMALAISSIIPDPRQVPHLRLATNKIPQGSNAIVLASPGTSRTGIRGLVGELMGSSVAADNTKASGDPGKRADTRRNSLNGSAPDAASSSATATATTTSSEADGSWSVLNYVAHGAIHANDLLGERVAVLSVSPSDRALGTAQILKGRGIFFAANYAESGMDWLDKIRTALEGLKEFQPTVLIVTQAFAVPDTCPPTVVTKLTLDLLSICSQLISVVEEATPDMSHHLRAHIEALQAFG